MQPASPPPAKRAPCHRLPSPGTGNRPCRLRPGFCAVPLLRVTSGRSLARQSRHLTAGGGDRRASCTQKRHDQARKCLAEDNVGSAARIHSFPYFFLRSFFVSVISTSIKTSSSSSAYFYFVLSLTRLCSLQACVHSFSSTCRRSFLFSASAIFHSFPIIALLCASTDSLT